MRDIVFGNGAIRWFHWHGEDPKKNVAWRWKMCWNRKSPQTDGVVTVQDFVDIWVDQYGEWRCDLAYLKYLYNFYENEGDGWWTWRGPDNPLYDLNDWNKNGRWSKWRSPVDNRYYWGITHYGNDYRFENVRQHYMERYPNLNWNRDAAARKEKMIGPDQHSWINKTNTTEEMMPIE